MFSMEQCSSAKCWTLVLGMRALGLQEFNQWLLVYCQLCTASVICKMVIYGCWRDLSRGCLLGNFRDKCCWNEAAIPFARGHGDLCDCHFQNKKWHRYAAVFNYPFSVYKPDFCCEAWLWGRVWLQGLQYWNLLVSTIDLFSYWYEIGRDFCILY